MDCFVVAVVVKAFDLIRIMHSLVHRLNSALDS